MAENAERNLRLFRELLTCAHNVYFWSFDTRMENIYTNCPHSKALYAILRMNQSQVDWLLAMAPQEQPVVLSDRLGLTWIADYEPDSEGELLYIHLIGPVFVADVSQSSLEMILLNMGISMGLRYEFLKVMGQLPVVPITRFFEYGLMLHYCIKGEKITISELQYPDPPQSAKSKEAHRKEVHGSWAMEQELLRLVEEGNLDYKEKAARLVAGSNLSNFGNGDSLRHIKNTAIIFTALCTRAAIRGGVPPEVAYTISDRYISNIEAAASFSEAVELNSAMQDTFVSRVHQCKTGNQSAAIQRCCNYIQLHLGEKLTVPMLAKKLGYSENYLTKKFKNEMGISLTQYITNLKIQKAKDLLVSGSESIQDICSQLGFGSQSYFGMVFHRETGMSPGAYRDSKK